MAPEISPALYRAGEGEPLVLLHGFTATWHCWRPVLPELVAHYEVIAPTLAGHAGGPAFDLDGPMNSTVAVDHLERHLDDLGVGKAHLVGNSMGGLLALGLAQRGRAQSVVALSPGGGWELDGTEFARIAKFFARQLKLTKASRRSLPRVMARPGSRKLAMRDVMRHGDRMQPYEAIDLARKSLECTVSDAVIEALRAADRNSVLADLDTIDAPVLLAWAEKDRVLPKEGCSPRYRREIPGAEYRVLPGVGHVPMWDDPRLVVRTITDWVESHRTADTLTAA